MHFVGSKLQHVFHHKVLKRGERKHVDVLIVSNCIYHLKNLALAWPTEMFYYSFKDLSLCPSDAGLQSQLLASLMQEDEVQG